MLTDTLLTRLELFLDELLIGGHCTAAAQQKELQKFFSEIHYSDREMLVGLAGMRWDPDKLHLLSGALYTTRFRSALIAGLAKRLEQAQDEELDARLELLQQLGEEWPYYGDAIERITTERLRKELHPAA